ncbi:Dam family site-specific DNA-(adenine-N6)-methyltransferase [Spiroplasma sp. AdecLV25b]|uniref:DNA adenine methylase n=1 Tax=Spiroplasma sp. AdecLV25b TaxID=3027162 RepID=UPI0027DFFD83|nr:Dam family site-specific DNA-(adenine-N6)-methyltransferase [Spiroplasma sp. AdecLV25b]
MKIRPFLKWVGGKTQLIKEIEKRMPKNFNNYLEPFIGGGALFFNMHNSNNNFIINDISSELINAYKAIKENPQKLMKLLDEHELNHGLNSKEYYFLIREQDRDINWNKKNIFIKTARLIYLNKTCFNGLYRVNKSGYFNVPWNKKEKIKLYEKNNILNLSRILNSNVEILNSDFENVCNYAQKGDFIFFDPPYDLIKKDTFDNYTKDKFGIEGQKRLSNLAHKLKEKGCYVMITNHNTPLINELYKDFTIDVVPVKRMINSNGEGRVGIETIIYNY